MGVKFTRTEADALADLIYYAVQGCDMPEDVLLYESIASKLDVVVVIEGGK